MTKEQAIEWLKSLNYCDGEETQDVAQAIDMAIKALEQQPSDDKITITMDKGTLKYSGHGYVAYKKDWFRKHFATEVKIMTGYDGYNFSDDCVSRQVVKDAVENVIAPYIPTFIGRYEKIPLELAIAIRKVPPVIPTPVWAPDSSKGNKVSWPSLEDLREKVEQGNEDGNN